MSNGETYSFTQGLSYNGKEVLFKVKVTITNEQGSGEGEGTTALMYGLEGPATHMHAFDLRGMPRGTYIVKVSTGSYREAKPITISR